jgi:predicted XRE-type DNA-binding protein
MTLSNVTIKGNEMPSYLEAKTTKELCAIMNLPESEGQRLEIRLQLVKAIRKTVTKRNLTHAQAAEITGFGRTVVTAIMNGHLEKISTDRLIGMAQSLGLTLSLKLT